MSKLEKQIDKLKLKPKDFTYEEARNLLNNLGFYEDNKGRTSGSRIEYRNCYDQKIQLHKPHPGNILKPYQVKIIINKLKELEVI